MATIHDYFIQDFTSLLNVGKIIPCVSKLDHVQVEARVHLDFEAGVTFVSYYVPATLLPTALCTELLNQANGLVKAMLHGLFVGMQSPGDKVEISADSLRFSHRVYIYLAEELQPAELEQVQITSEVLGLGLQIRGPQYAIAKDRIMMEHPKAFISHDSRDKDEIARPLAVALQKMMCPVWFDEFTLKVGDPLRESIEDGLKRCNKCILILTPNFLSNKGWTKAEFNSIFTRELLESRNLVLPVWAGVTSQEVYDYSPTLKDRVATNWGKGLDDVVRELLQVLR